MTNNINDDFLDLLEKPLDDAQTRALKVNRNAVIAAGAGSGKTQVLATRFSWLIMTGQAKVDEILTLTYTNKAASEMYQRIYKSLSYFANYKESEKLTTENRKLAQEALDSFSNAHIQTLDSYCGGIVRQCANRYGIKPDFTTGSSDSSSDIKSKAFRFVMEHKENIGIQTFADPGKIQEFSNSIFASTIEKYTSLATENSYFVNKLEIQRKEIVQAWNYYFLGRSSNNDLIFSDIKSLKTQMSELSDVLNASDKKDDVKKADYVKTIISLFNKTSEILNKESITEEDIINNTDKLKDSINAAEDIMSSIVSATAKSGAIKEVKSAVIKVRNEFNPLLSSLAVYLKQYKAIYELNILFDDFLKEINSAKLTS